MTTSALCSSIVIGRLCNADCYPHIFHINVSTGNYKNKLMEGRFLGRFNVHLSSFMGPYKDIKRVTNATPNVKERFKVIETKNK